MADGKAKVATSDGIGTDVPQYKDAQAVASSIGDAATAAKESSSAAPAALKSTAADTARTKSGLLSAFESNPYFNAGFGLMLFGAALAVSRRGVTTAAAQAQRRLLVSLEIPSKDRAHPWFLQWMGAQAKAQAMREAGLLPHHKESFAEFLGLRSRNRDQASGDAQTGNGDVIDPLRTSEHHRASPIRIYSHELSLETIQADMKRPASSQSAAQLIGVPATEQQQSAASSSRDARFAFVPGPGTHWFRYKGCWMRLTRERNGRLVDLTTGAPWETISLTTLRSHQHLFNELLAEARQLALTSTEGRTTIFTAWGTEWRPFGQPRRARDLQSVILGKGKRQRIANDVRQFMQRGWWYAERGIPYRRGYLLHGSPGSGKSSFIYALAGSLDMSICMLNLSERGLTDDKLNFLLSNAPPRSILLLEDVDSAFIGRQRAAEADGYQANITFSGLLNSLDGVASSESRIIFMTTNHPERLDPALIRPGRVDYIEELGDAEPEQVKELYVRFYSPRRSPNGEQAQVQPASTDGRDEAALEDEKRQIEQQAAELADVVQRESVRRRRSLGLDDAGRTVVSASSAAATPSARIQPAASGGVSMAELQGLFIQFPDNGRAAIDAFRAFVESIRATAPNAG